MSKFQLINPNVELVKGNELNSSQEAFVNHWSEVYFGAVAVSHDLDQAPVHWRLFLRDAQGLVSHVALTEFFIEVDGGVRKTAAVGGLLTAKDAMGRGYANQLMDVTEEFFFNQLNLNLGILFCLPGLIPFYAKRGWESIAFPVTLAHRDGIVTWPEAVMILPKPGMCWEGKSIHVPRQ
jgi:hypothetical protein